MRFSNKILYFGPATVLVEWSGILIGASYIEKFTLDRALSTATTSPWPLPLIFGLTLTIASVTYFIFTLPLARYSKFVPHTAAIAGIAWILTAWIPYYANGSLLDVIHNFFSILAALGYIAIAWQLQKHPVQKVARFTTIIFRLLTLSTLLAFLSLYVVHRYIAVVQLLILVLVQLWSIHLGYHTWTHERHKLAR